MLEEYRQSLIGLTQDMVNIPSENHPPDGDEAAAQAYLAAYMQKMGLTVDVFCPEDVPGYRQDPEYLHEREMAGRNNVVGTWKGSGGGKSLVLCGHIDVAPKEPLPWTVCEPFSSIVKDGKLYGRGSSDMKGGLACAVMAVQILKERGFSPKGDIILESVVDEEYASGNGTLAACAKGYKGDFAVIFEPTGLNVCAANVGGLMLNIRMKGNPGMPYTGEKVFNIAYALADMLKIVERFEEERENAPCPPLWENAVQKRKVVVTKVKAGEVQPHGQLSSPIDAWVEISVQTYPGETAAGVVEELNALIQKEFRHAAEVEVTPLYHYVEPCNVPADHEGVRLMAQMLEKTLNKPVDVTIAPFPCDMFIFQKCMDTPGVIFGPVGGNLHGPDEWVDIDSMMDVVRTTVEFIENWCG